MPPDTILPSFVCFPHPIPAPRAASQSGPCGSLAQGTLKQRLAIILDLASASNRSVDKSLEEPTLQQPSSIALEQIFSFLRGKSFPEESKIGAYFSYLQQKWPAIEDFLAEAMKGMKIPVSLKVCRAYTHFLIKEEGGENSLIRIAQHEGLPCAMRVASALELSFAEHKEGVTLLARFITREDFYKYRNYMLKNVRSPMLKQALQQMSLLSK